jgi:predicted nucleotidyltransferase
VSREDSDSDLIVEFTRPVGLCDFIGLRQRLGSLLGRRVDLVTRAALKPRIRDRVLREAIRAA